MNEFNNEQEVPSSTIPKNIEEDYYAVNENIVNHVLEQIVSEGLDTFV